MNDDDVAQSVFTSVFFFSMSIFKKYFYLQEAGLMCTLSNWLTGGGMVAGGGIVQKREIASLHIFSDDS